jgi:phage gp36-like protein
MTRYATTTDFARLGLPTAATQGIATASIEAALDAFAATMDGYLQARGYVLPLSSWGDDLRRCNCQGAAWDVLRVRGYDPNAGGDEAVRLGFEDAMKWLRDVSAGRVTPSSIVDSTPSTDEPSQQTVMVTNRRRNWTRGR